MERHVLKRQSNYCYEDGVLKNKFDIHDAEKLDALARDITTFRISQLSCNNDIVHNFFQFDDYLKLHYYLFSDIYPFAGEIRDESIYKSNEPYFTGENNKTCIFAEPGCIVMQMREYFRKMQGSIRRIKTRDDLLNFISYYYGEINFFFFGKGWVKLCDRKYIFKIVLLFLIAGKKKLSGLLLIYFRRE